MSSLQVLNRSRSRLALTALCAAVSLFLAGCPGGPSGGGDTADTTPPAAPAGLSAIAASASQINLAWPAATDNVGVTGYRVERCQGAGCNTFAEIATPTAASFNDTGLGDGTSYSYRVRAADAAGNLGAYSSTASATTLDTTPPTAPTALSAAASSATQIDLSWTAATDNVGVTGYRVERCQGVSCSNFVQIATPTAASFSDTGLTGNTSYSYRVRAVDAAANPGPYSNSASASTPLEVPSVSALPGNGQVALFWSAVPGATSYNVYSSLTDPVTVSGTKTTVLVPVATLASLTNGTAIYAAVTAVNLSGESALSKQVCGVPTASSLAGLTLYDPLCESALDGRKWQSPLFSSGVSGGALVLRAQVSNMEPRDLQSKIYAASVTVNAGGQRVTTLQADITVPAATASRTGSADLRALVQLSYQPPADRLNFPGGNQNLLFMQVGLADSGNGLQVYRRLLHQDNPSGTIRSGSGISYVDPDGFTPNANGTDAEAPAVYGTPYTVSASLDESTGIFTWTVAGGAFGFTGVSGTADPSTYLAGNTHWTAIGPKPLAGAGFSAAFLRSALADLSVAGGSDGSLSAHFQNVRVGFNNAVATLFDDFGGTPPNSGPTELSAVKWSQPGGVPGNASMALTGGKLTARVQATSADTSGFRNFQSLTFNDPASVNTLQANVTVTSCANPYTGIRFNTVSLQGNFFNDGNAGTTPPNTNQPNSNVGDVRAALVLDCLTNNVTISITRFTTQTSAGLLGSFVFPLGTPVTGANHKLKLAWDPGTPAFTFQVDNLAPIIVDPTTIGAIIITPTTVVGPANSPLRQLVWGVIVGSNPPDPTNVSASMDLTVNNVFTAP